PATTPKGPSTARVFFAFDRDLLPQVAAPVAHLVPPFEILVAQNRRFHPGADPPAHSGRTPPRAICRDPPRRHNPWSSARTPITVRQTTTHGDAAHQGGNHLLLPRR